MSGMTPLHARHPGLFLNQACFPIFSSHIAIIHAPWASRPAAGLSSWCTLSGPDGSSFISYHLFGCHSRKEEQVWLMWTPSCSIFALSALAPLLSLLHDYKTHLNPWENNCIIQSKLDRKATAADKQSLLWPADLRSGLRTFAQAMHCFRTQQPSPRQPVTQGPVSTRSFITGIPRHVLLLQRVARTAWPHGHCASRSFDGWVHQGPITMCMNLQVMRYVAVI